MTLPESPWPEDLAFQTLAHAVRDGVTVAMNRGYRISNSRGEGCCCPLGAVVLMESRFSRLGPCHPSPWWARQYIMGGTLTEKRYRPGLCAVLPDEQMLWAFISGFEEGQESTSLIDAVRASARLGIWYRQRFLGKKTIRYSGMTRRQRLARVGKATQP